MRIGVVADTHSQKLPLQMLKDFQGVDLIVHAGDFCSLKDLEVLSDIKELKGVYGNMDDAAIIKRLPRRQIFPLGLFQIGLFHGEGPPKTILKVVQEEFRDDRVDVVIFGHSHQPLNQRIHNVLYFNPGSPTDRVNAPYRSYGLLTITDNAYSGQLIKVKETDG